MHMEITRATLDKIAHLARLEFNEAEAGRMMADLTEIVNWVEKLRTVDTGSAQPLASMSQEVNSFRDDIPHQTLTREEALIHAPQHDTEFFRVPKVIA